MVRTVWKIFHSERSKESTFLTPACSPRSRWLVAQLVDRYMRLATVCLVILAGIYVRGLVSAYRETRGA